MAGGMTVAARFAARFAGLERSHGAYDVGAAEAEPGKKVEGKALTVHRPLTLELYERHLAGRYGLGVVPIRDDATVVFGAIDIDDYAVVIARIAEEVTRLRLPLVVCRTKSGGLHLYLFMREPVPAELVRTTLMEWAIALGYAGVEVFPKQTRLAGPEDWGNWINLPYFSGDRSTRYAVNEKGLALTLAEFLDQADRTAVTAEQLRTFKLPEEPSFKDVLAGAPPCLQSLARRGFPPGTRNNALYSFAVYLSKRYGATGWRERLQGMNDRFMTPPLPPREVQQVIKSVERGGDKFFYRCGEQPILGACNKQVCLTREYGIGQLGDDPGVVYGRLVKLTTTPPTWLWDVNGARIQLTTAQLMDQGRCQARVIDALNVWPEKIKPQAWKRLVTEKLANAEVIQAPDDATRKGQLWDLLRQYCTGRVQAKTRDELLMKRPWTDPASQRTFFSSVHFLEWLRSHRVATVAESELYTFLHDRGFEHHFLKLKGKGFNAWSLPAFEQQTEPHDVNTATLGDAS